MNQRSTSALRKMKTDLGDDHGFERRVAKVIKEKKQFISKMTTPRSYNQNRNYSSHNPNNKIQKGIEHAQSKQKQKYIKIDRNFIENIQQKGNFCNFFCINHPKKKGLFEDIENRDYFYCHQCAINLVKSNIQVMGITSQSLIIKMFLQEQLQKIMQQEIKTRNIIQDYYNNLRQKFLTLYKESYKTIIKNQIVQFGHFQINQNLQKMIESLGQIDLCFFKFQGDLQKQNNGIQSQQNRDSIDRHIGKYNSRDRHPDKQESNNILDTSQKSSSFLNRSRQSSFYKKNSKIQIQKNKIQYNKYDNKKQFYLR